MQAVYDEGADLAARGASLNSASFALLTAAAKMLAAFPAKKTADELAA